MGFVTKSIRAMGKVFLALCSLALILCLLLIISLQGFVLWLNTPPGSAWLSHQIETAAADSPYQIKLNGFALSGLFTLHAAELQLLDEDGVFLEAHHLRLKSSPFPLAVKRLRAAFIADHINLLRLPTSDRKNNPESEDNQDPFVFPDLYFTKLDFEIDITHLQLPDDMIKGGANTRLQLSQNIFLSGQMLQGKGQIRIGEENHLDLDGSYDLAQNAFLFQAEGLWQDVHQIDRDITAPLRFKSKIRGKIDDFAGDLSVTSAYKQIPAHVSANLARRQHMIHLSEISGTARDVTLSGKLSYDTSASLADGTLDGRFGSFDLLSVLSGVKPLSGTGTFSATLGHEQGVQKAEATLDIQNGADEDMKAERINAAVTLPDVKDWKTTRATLTISNAVLPETDVKSAEVHITPADQGIDLKVDAKAYSLRPFYIAGNAQLQNLSPLALEIPHLTFKAGNGSLTLKGAIKDNIPDIQFTTDKLDLSALPYADLSNLPFQLRTFDGTLGGTMATPVIKIDYGIISALKNIPNTSISGTLTYADMRASALFQAEGKGIRSLSGDVTVPVSLSLQPFTFQLNENAALSGKTDGQFNLAALVPLFLGQDYDVRGNVNMDARIAGDLVKPELDGSLTLKDGYVKDEVNDVELKSLLAAATFKGQSLTLSKLNATDAAESGSLSGKGVFNLSDPGHPDITADLKMTNMHLLKGDLYDARLNADMNIRTKRQDYYLEGIITPEEIQIILPERFEQSIPTLNIVEQDQRGAKTRSLMERLNLEMDFKADNRIFVRGWGLDAELNGELNITGTADSPLVNGQLQTSRARYEELGRRFDVNHAILRFQGMIPPSPYLDVKTSTNLDGMTAHILISGRAADPKLAFSSTPSLPEDEVLSHILFGEDISKISPYQAVQLAQTLSRFSGHGGGGFDLLGTVRDITGLDDIRVEGVGTEDATVGAGKYITDKVYLELEQGSGEKSGAASVEIEVTPNVKVESKAGQNGDTDVGVFWEWDY